MCIYIYLMINTKKKTSFRNPRRETSVGSRPEEEPMGPGRTHNRIWSPRLAASGR